MNALLLAPALLSTLLLAAHFLRGGQAVLVLLILAVIPLLLLRARWAVRVAQVVLVLGAAEWLRTLLAMARTRIAFSEPWSRMALILGAVTLVTAGSALLLEVRRQRRISPRVPASA